MRFGHNSNVTIGEVLYHVQTEDRGATHALIDTTVYYGGGGLPPRPHQKSGLFAPGATRGQKAGPRGGREHPTLAQNRRSRPVPKPPHFLPGAGPSVGA